LLLAEGAVYGASVLRTGEIAPDFAVGERTLYQMLAERAAVIFFFPKAFTPG
jgi:peroxiredoxin